MNRYYPHELQYTNGHFWLKQDGEEKTATVGLTAYAIEQMKTILFVGLPEPGDAITMEEPMGNIESVKAVSDLMAPVSGYVSEINEALMDSPSSLNDDPYGTWLVKVRDLTDIDELMSADEYRAFCEDWGE